MADQVEEKNPLAIENTEPKKEKPNPLKGKNPAKMVGLVLLGLLLVGGAIIAGLKITDQITNTDNYDRGAVLFTINNDSFYENELREVTQYPIEKAGYNEEGALKAAFDAYKVIVVAKDAGINPTEQEIEQDLAISVPENVRSEPDFETKYMPWFKLLSTRAVVNNYIGAESVAGFTGYSFVFYFGQHIEYGDDYKPDGLNDQKLIADDRAYAKEKAEYYHSQLRDGNMTTEQVDSEIKADDRLVNKFVNTKNPFGESGDSTWEEDVFYLAVRNHISTNAEPGLSEVQVGQGYAGPVINANDNLKDLYYYFVFLDNATYSTTLTVAEFQKLLNEASVSGIQDDATTLKDGQVEATADDKKPKTDAELGIEGLDNGGN